MKSYRIPLSIYLLLARLFEPIRGSSAPPRRANRVLPGQVVDAGLRSTPIPPPSLRSILAGRLGDGPSRRLASRTPQNAAAAAVSGSATAAMGEWVNEMAGRGREGTRAPSEEEISA